MWTASHRTVDASSGPAEALVPAAEPRAIIGCRLLAQAAAPPVAPNRIWVADITYIETAQSWAYLAAVMDLYSRRIVGWAMADHLRSSLPQQALSRALQTRRPCQGLLHPDRGIQYASHEYRSLLQSNHSQQHERPRQLL